MKGQEREFSRTEFIALVLSVVIWLIDKRYGTDILSSVDAGEFTAARAQVLQLAAAWRETAGGNPDLAIYVGVLIYVGRKAEKMVNRIWGKVA